MTFRRQSVVVMMALVAASCAGGARPELDAASLAPVAEPTPTPTATPAPDDVALGAEVVGPDEGLAPDEADEPTAAPSPTAIEATEPTPTEVAPADPDAFPGQGVATVTLSDGRSYEATVGCEVRNEGSTWRFSFGGQTADAVLLEGAYDTSQPDFVILFVAGPDSLNGDDVLLSNVNGGDDLSSTNDSGDQWNASIRLWTPEGEAVDAQLAASCG